MNPKPIGLFDSGIGGLTVVREIQKKVPNETLCYFGDTARVPYGTKSPETISRYSEEITHFLMSHDVKIVVVACNTVSSVSLHQVAQIFPGPVVGVVEPGVRAALKCTRNKRVGVIGTKSTVKSQSYQRRLIEAEPAINVFAQACPLFVPLVEEAWEGEKVACEIARRYLEPLKQEGIDTLILGCTHYPLLQNVIQEVMGDEVVLVSSAEEAAKEVYEILQKTGDISQRKAYKNRYYASDDIENFKRLCQRICGSDNATFTEAGAEFFSVVQKVHQFKEKLFVSQVQWFEDINDKQR